MIQVKEGKWGRYIEAFITTPVTAELDDDDTRTEISEDEAKGMLNRTLDELAGSNDGSEFLANAGLTFKKPE